MTDIFEELKLRGVIKQTVFEEEVHELLNNNKVSFYIGFDPTADSLHVGHFASLVMASRLQKAGHKPYILLGGGTAMVGDPTGRNDMRKMLTVEEINHNISCFKKQMKNLLSFDGENGVVFVNNADWLLKLNYIEFLREIGGNMTVNRMLSFDCYKNRWENGLSFLELNYMPMQAYDFYHLFKKHNVLLQVGGDDQWANMLAGAELIRKKENMPAFALTFPLLARTDGKKMGKSQKGAVWLDEAKTSPLEMYQFFRNTDDSLVAQQLKLLTFVPLNEILELTQFNDERMNLAKEKLAFEVVKLVHGEQVALQTVSQIKASFGGNAEDMQSVVIDKENCNNIIDLLVATKLASSKGEARRLIDGNGVKINERLVTDYNDEVVEKNEPYFVLHKGKKSHIKLEIKK